MYVSAVLLNLLIYKHVCVYLYIYTYMCIHILGKMYFSLWVAVKKAWKKLKHWLKVPSICGLSLSRTGAMAAWIWVGGRPGSGRRQERTWFSWLTLVLGLLCLNRLPLGQRVVLNAHVYPTVITRSRTDWSCVEGVRVFQTGLIVNLRGGYEG